MSEAAAVGNFLSRQLFWEGGGGGGGGAPCVGLQGVQVMSAAAVDRQSLVKHAYRRPSG